MPGLIRTTPFTRSLLDDADAATVRATLGLGTAATQASGAFDAAGAAAAAQAASQPIDAALTAFAALTIAANSLTLGTGADAFSQVTFGANTFPARSSSGDIVAKTITDFGLSLLDDANAAAARTTIGLASTDEATFATITSTNWIYGASIYVTSQTVLRSSSAGFLRLMNTSETSFTQLNLGPIDVAFPAFRVNGAGVDVITGTNSARTTIRATKFIVDAPGTYTASNVTTDRAYDANATTTDELADVLGTLIADLRAAGIVA